MIKFISRVSRDELNVEVQELSAQASTSTRCYTSWRSEGTSHRADTVIKISSYLDWHLTSIERGGWTSRTL